MDMQNVQENIKTVAGLLTSIREHPMCASVQLDNSRITVIYPKGDFIVDGVTTNFKQGKAKQLQTVLERMEYDWINSYPKAVRN